MHPVELLGLAAALTILGGIIGLFLWGGRTLVKPRQELDWRKTWAKAREEFKQAGERLREGEDGDVD